MAAALDELERAAGLADKDAVAIPNPLLVVPKLTYSTMAFGSKRQPWRIRLRLTLRRTTTTTNNNNNANVVVLDQIACLTVNFVQDTHAFRTAVALLT